MLSRRLIQGGEMVDVVTKRDRYSHKSVNVSVYFVVTVKNNLL